MKSFTFGALTFCVSDDNRISMQQCFCFEQQGQSLCQLDPAGGAASGTNRLWSYFGEHTKLRYVSHEITDSVLTVLQRSHTLELTSVYERFADTDAIRVYQILKNISEEPVDLELLNTFGFTFAADGIREKEDWYLHKFHNMRYTESLPEVKRLADCELQWLNGVHHIENVGNYSTKEFLPEAILENRRTEDFLMFQIESYHGWGYEFSYCGRRLMLQLGGPSAIRHAWNKRLMPGESYVSVPVALAFGKSLNGVIGEMTKYRRHIKAASPADASIPTIYNEYMHYSWDDPYAEKVYKTAPAVAATGCEYYIIDCGWHNGRKFNDMMGMYKQFGTWFEDRERFPEGLKAISDYIHSLGMKFGLWLAPEVVGIDNEKMLAYYDDDCFFTRNGQKLRNETGYLLDFRAAKVRAYMTETIRRMVEDYGCDYIKFDGCPNSGFGTELCATSPGDGLEKAMEAFLSWTESVMETYPGVIFEDCAGGGQRLDYRALSMFSLASTSDQTAYNQYPYISGNILVSVLPEQAAVWSYPVDSALYDPNHEEATNERVTRERVVLNMVNALLGRIHLASRIQLLDGEKSDLIKEGMEVYHAIAKDKLKALPYLPKGYTDFGDSFVSAGLITDEKVYLAVWNLSGERDVTLPLPEIKVKSAAVLYPKTLPTDFSYDEGSLTLHFSEDEQARFFELTL